MAYKLLAFSLIGMSCRTAAVLESTKICRGNNSLGYWNRWPPRPEGVRGATRSPGTAGFMAHHPARTARREPQTPARLKPVWTEAFSAMADKPSAFQAYKPARSMAI